MQNASTINIVGTLTVKEKINVFLDLSKIRITGFVAFSAIIGYLLADTAISFRLLWVSLGVMMLAFGSAAMNHWQESDKDLNMDRTKSRPIPSGKIKANSVLLYSILSIAAGLAVLYISAGVMPFLLGIITAAWYNLIYTPMKRRSAIAVIPGGFIGAIPPVIGWTAAGGSVDNFSILSFALFLFVWQIPHFWLLLLMYGDQYSNAGFPSLTDKFSRQELGIITYGWIAVLVITSVLFGMSDFVSGIYTFVPILLLGAYLLYNSTVILKKVEKIYYRKSFLNINLYVLAIVLILTIDKLVIKDLLR